MAGVLKGSGSRLPFQFKGPEERYLSKYERGPYAVEAIDRVYILSSNEVLTLCRKHLKSRGGTMNSTIRDVPQATLLARSSSKRHEQWYKRN